MKSELRTIRVMMYVSEVHPEIETENEQLAGIIDWADENLAAFDVVREMKSGVYGKAATRHPAWARLQDDAGAVIERLRALRDDLKFDRPGQLFNRWQAEFILQHHSDPKLRSGLFQQHAIWTDGVEYPRQCLIVDYTDASLEEALDRFHVWASFTESFRDATRITVNGITRRELMDHSAIKKMMRERSDRKAAMTR